MNRIKKKERRQFIITLILMVSSALFGVYLHEFTVSMLMVVFSVLLVLSYLYNVFYYPGLKDGMTFQDGPVKVNVTVKRSKILKLVEEIKYGDFFLEFDQYNDKTGNVFYYCYTKSFEGREINKGYVIYNVCTNRLVNPEGQICKLLK